MPRNIISGATLQAKAHPAHKTQAIATENDHMLMFKELDSESSSYSAGPFFWDGTCDIIASYKNVLV